MFMHDKRDGAHSLGEEHSTSYKHDPIFLGFSKLLTLPFCAGRQCRQSAAYMNLTGRTDVHFCQLNIIFLYFYANSVM